MDAVTLKRLIRVGFPALVLAAGTVVYWGKIAQRDALRSEAKQERQRPTIVGLPAIHVTPTPLVPEARAAEAAPRASLADSVSGTVKRLEDLSPEDQPGLDRLFADVREEIRGREEEFARYFRARMKSVDTMPTKSAFFLVKALIDNTGPAAAGPIRDLLSQKQPPLDDPHHGIPHTNLVKSFAIEQWADSPGARAAAPDMLPVLRGLAEREPDLSVAREAALAVSKHRLASDPEAFIREVRRVRKPNEQFAFEDL